MERRPGRGGNLRWGALQTLRAPCRCLRIHPDPAYDAAGTPGALLPRDGAGPHSGLSPRVDVEDEATDPDDP